MTISTIAYEAEIEAWRRKGEEALRRDWVSLVGRFELQPGQNRIGADPEGEIVLPAGSAPDQLGVINFAAGDVVLHAAPNADVLVNGEPAHGSVTLRSDAAGAPDIVTVGTLTFFIIQRGERTIVRVRDANSPTLASFSGRRWFAIDENYRVEGVFAPYDPPKPLSITDLLGDTSAPTSPGALSFTLDGQEHQLDATGWRDGGLVLHFRDATNSDQTYSGGRAVVTPVPADGLVTIDFKPNNEPALRPHRVRHLPAAAAAEPARHQDRGRRAAASSALASAIPGVAQVIQQLKAHGISQRHYYSGSSMNQARSRSSAG